MIRLSVAALMLVVCLAGIQAASAADFGRHKTPYPAAPAIGPACDTPDVLRRIMSRFDSTEARYWKTGVRMALITDARPTSFRDLPPATTFIRYCAATAYLTDGARHELVYWMRSNQGFAGYGWGVEYCLVGRDRQMSYAPQCRMLRPL